MERIEDCISFVVGKAVQQVTRRARALLAPHGITPVHYAVLKVLSEDGPLSGTEIGRRMVLDSASVTGVLDRMAAQGLIERRPNPEDRRAQRVAATEESLALLPVLDAAMDRLNAEAASVTGEPHQVMFGALRRLGDAGNWSDDV